MLYFLVTCTIINVSRERCPDHGSVPYIVAGAGGYAHVPKLIHRLQKGLEDRELPFPTTRRDVKLENFNATDSGYLRVSASAKSLTFEYFAVPFEGDPPREAFDEIEITATRDKSL